MCGLLFGLFCKARGTKRSIREAGTGLKRRTKRPSASLFTGQTLNVQMGHKAFQAFSNGQKQSIGTNGLDGCPAIVIASSGGAIVAHVNPGSGPLIDQQLIALINTYHNHATVLSDARTFVMVATGKDQSFPDSGLDQASLAVGDYIISRLAGDALFADKIIYHTDEPADARPGQRGTVVVTSEEDGTVAICVNDKHIGELVEH